MTSVPTAERVIHLIDSRLLGETTAKLMDAIDSDPVTDEDGEPLQDIEMTAVGIVVVCSNGDHTFTRTFCSDVRAYQQIGLFSAALDCAKEGV